MVTKLVTWHTSSTNLAEISFIETCAPKRFKIEAEIKLLSCRQDSHFTIDLYKELRVVMVTKVVIGHSSASNLAEISLIETCVRKRFEIEAEIKLLSCWQNSNFTIDLYKELRVVMVTKLVIGHGSSTNLAEISLIGTYIRKRFEIEAEIKLLSCWQGNCRLQPASQPARRTFSSTHNTSV